MATLQDCRRFEAIQNRRLEIGGRKLILSSDHHAERDGYFGTLAVASRLKDRREGGVRVQSTGFGVRLQSSEFRVQGSGFRVQGSENSSGRKKG